ncbi:MAG: hypothetical protein KatS3mg113_0969 [Planctomycetaceae bacterium]|nr:MAG: hypothetical protein KatS3mg113_0969 [Planctomycetaceae bacterium]
MDLWRTKPVLRWGAVITAQLILCGVAWSQLESKVWSVAELNQARDRWPDLQGKLLQVEGRVGAINHRELRLLQCDIEFKSSEEVKFGRKIPKNVLLEGRLHLDRERRSWVFLVQKITPQSDDIEQLHEREALMVNPQPYDWYRLGEWALQRAQFYQDPVLEKAAQGCFSKGLALESRTLPQDDYLQRLKLADKALNWRLPEVIIEELRHEALNVWWRQVRQEESSAKLDQLLQQALRCWPDAQQPVSGAQPELFDRYEHNPDVCYRQANSTQRAMLHRYFVARVKLRQFQLRATPDGRNGNEIAELIERELPEFTLFAREYRNRALRYKIEHVDRASREEFRELMGRLNPQSPDYLVAAKRWLTTHAERCRMSADPEEHLNLARDYREWLKDDKQALYWLESAWKLDPQSDEVIRTFQEWGYRWDGRTWKNVSHRPAGVTPAARGLELGMSPGDVRKLMGEPQHRTMIATRQVRDEFWIYGDSSLNPLVLHFRQAASSSMRLHSFYHRTDP